MQNSKRWSLGVGVLILALVGIVVGRTLILMPASFPSDDAVSTVRLIEVDKAAVSQRLSQAIQFKTVTQQNPADTDWAEFARFQDWLVQTYPHFHGAMKTEKVATYTPMHIWSGTDASLAPIVFLAHQDVVPALENDAGWDHPPFAGTVADGYIYGRGTLDDKGSLMAILEAADRLAAQGYQPQRTLMFIFGHDEEVTGSGAQMSAELLKARGISPYAVIDEGGAMIEGINGVEEPVALIGVAEKGYFTVTLTAEADGGHSSAPPEYTAIGALSRAIAAIEANPFESALNEVTAGTFKAFAPRQGFLRRMAAANLWLFGSVVEEKMREDKNTRTLLTTSIAPTIINAGFKENALPRDAVAYVNFRIHPRDSQAKVLSHLERVINDPAIKIAPASGLHSEPSPVSEIGTGPYKLIESVIEDVYPDMIVAPNMLAGGTDSRFFSIVTSNIYRFAPFTYENSDIGRVHGLNERIGVESYATGIAIYDLLIQRAGNSER